MIYKMSSKNKLQEYCQKYGYDMPVYHTIRIENTEAHLPLFDSYIIFNQKQYGPYEYLRAKNKKDAEKNIAEYVVNDLYKNAENNKIVYNGKQKLCLMIDIENKQKIIDEIEFSIDVQNIDIYLFLSKSHHSAENKKLYEKYNMMVIDGIRSDAADTNMIFAAGKLYKDYDKMGIVTGDHFGQTLVEILVNHGLESKLLLNINDIIEFIK